MKRTVCLILGLIALLTLSACGEEESVGGDWHVWGLYDFDIVNGETVAIGRVFDEESNLIGYDIYQDGESAPGPIVCELRCSDGGYTHEAMSESYSILVSDRNSDSVEDIGMKLANGDILWYVATLDENGLADYDFTEVEVNDKQE